MAASFFLPYRFVASFAAAPVSRRSGFPVRRAPGRTTPEPYTGSPATHTLCESGCGTITDASKSPHVSAT